jgi:hypothetical protein
MLKGLNSVEKPPGSEDRGYFAEPSEAPEWRAQWVERMES